MKTAKLLVLLAIALATVGVPSLAEATPFNVTLDTTALMNVPGSLVGPFSLFFQLTDGSGGGDGNNTITLSDFAFGGGTAQPGATAFGGASGDLESSVVLNDNVFFTSFQQVFAPGATLSFRLDTTTNVDVGGTPDALAFSILDSTGFPIATADPTLADTLFTLNLDSSNPTFLSFGTDPTRTAITLGAPDIRAATDATPVPEPATLTLLGLGLAMTGLRNWRRTRL